ncbi:phytanoyl-CoA dioxygenase PhyH [Nonlabens dokdonensis]|jgi:hypothetical protein|uniref:PhyH domain containing protein n=2 Tax=Nonlabens dokdonensis TaxID=328515 RepID=L7WD71_NONDD|nr:phytanoyl-CoA dioxygenase family protein [Nonlabens dokdonensis]AGC78202.1 PhyH domain containing protein [Nonlabens dokdonensis DSW-6]PZX37905.1 phytanoyl-CoA dioxygenase PhyH [Nonlabens dokdonensis]
MLTKEQIESFKEDGVLILRNFFPKQEMNTWRNEAHDYHKNPLTSEDWKNAIMNYSGNTFNFKNDAHPAFHNKMKDLYQCFNDQIEWNGENELVARWPEIDAEWLGARTPHLDFPVYDRIRTLANSVFYLNDVTIKGAPLMYWKKSHKVAWEYFKKHPSHYMAQGELSQGQIFEILTDAMDSEPIPFYGKAGDLMIWHSLILHSPSVNLSHDARLAVIGRWGATIKEDEFRFDFSKDIWDKWNLNSI